MKSFWAGVEKLQKVSISNQVERVCKTIWENWFQITFCISFFSCLKSKAIHQMKRPEICDTFKLRATACQHEDYPLWAGFLHPSDSSANKSFHNSKQTSYADWTLAVTGIFWWPKYQNIYNTIFGYLTTSIDNSAVHIEKVTTLVTFNSLVNFTCNTCK